MRFGPVAPEKAVGCVLAHSLRLPGRILHKGKPLTESDVSDIAEAGIAEVTVAVLGARDVAENAAASKIGKALLSDGFEVTEPVAGRVNLVARTAGLVRIEADVVHAINRIDEAVTLATLPDQTRVDAGRLVATIKIIPYAVPVPVVKKAVQLATGKPLRLCPNTLHTADLILTNTPGMKPSLIGKAQAVTESRLHSLGLTLDKVLKVPHDESSVANAIASCGADMVLILGASATSDRADVGPAGLIRAGGELLRFGMPVDPGNLLFTGSIEGRWVVGLPGCARSPALNGADWVLQQLVAGQEVSGNDIAQMGVGGLLKEIPTRRQPRATRSEAGNKVELLLLAAGASRRMRGEDKLLRQIDGEALLRRSAETALASNISAVIVVVGQAAEDRTQALQGLDLQIVSAVDWQEGMAASLRAGMQAVSPDAAAVVVALADMPEVTPDHINRLIAAFDPADKREICRAESATGKAGHPVLFSRRFFENLMDLTGDRGAKDLLSQVPEFVVGVPTTGRGAVIDLDTPEDWRDWQADRES